jgi:hypothetical protein
MSLHQREPGPLLWLVVRDSEAVIEEVDSCNSVSISINISHNRNRTVNIIIKRTPSCSITIKSTKFDLHLNLLCGDVVVPMETEVAQERSRHISIRINLMPCYQ